MVNSMTFNGFTTINSSITTVYGNNKQVGKLGPIWIERKKDCETFQSDNENKILLWLGNLIVTYEFKERDTAYHFIMITKFKFYFV